MSQRKLWVAFFIGLLALALRVQPALAHEEIMIGDYTVKIGWLSEPPVVGLQNAIVVHVVTASDEQPVEDVSGLTVAISYGGQDKTLSLQPLGEDAPGQFAATIIPTVPGQYTVRLGGTLGDTPVDAELEPEEVGSADTLQFPAAASEESASTGEMNWLLFISLLIGSIALILAVMALRKAQ